MSPKTYIWLIGFASALALVSFLAILFLFPPESAGGVVLVLFFLSLFLALCGFFSLVNFYFRRRRQRNNLAVYSLGISFREGTLLSALLVGFLAMKYFQVFYWWTALIFLIVVVAIEMAFLYSEE
jgi:hypothetical protein